MAISLKCWHNRQHATTVDRISTNFWSYIIRTVP